jgi:hypothetical protein
MAIDNTVQIIDSTPEQAYQHFQKVATFDPAVVIPFRVDPHLAQHNALLGLAAVLEHESRIAKDLPLVNLAELREIQPLTHAVIFAAGRVNRTPEATLLRDLMPEAYQLRRKLLFGAIALGESNLLPAREIEAIRKGNGKVDAVQDLLQLAALYRRHESKIEGMHPVEPADLDRADQLGQQLLEILRPAAAKGPKPGNSELEASIDARDRLWTLLTIRHEQLWKVGAWLFGYEAREKVPVLGARRLRRKPEEEPAPVGPVEA